LADAAAPRQARLPRFVGLVASCGLTSVVLLILALAVGGCAPTTPSATAGAVGSAGSPTTSLLPAASNPGDAAPSSGAALTSAPTPGSSGALVVDPGLLAVLPAAVDGVALSPSPETAAGMAGDADLARSASGVAVAMAVAPGASATGGGDLVVTSVVRLRPGVFTDAFYAGWRSAYDEAACAQAGGVSGHAQVRIAARTVDEASCTGGARTAHVHLDGDILVSLTAVGDPGFSDQLLAGLHP